MTAIGQLQAELQPHKRRHSKTKFTASYGRLGSNGLRARTSGPDEQILARVGYDWNKNKQYKNAKIQ